jgi:hypothetical protein
VEGDVELAC